jgi:hypothetical protein
VAQVATGRGSDLLTVVGVLLGHSRGKARCLGDLITEDGVVRETLPADGEPAQASYLVPFDRAELSPANSLLKLLRRPGSASSRAVGARPRLTPSTSGCADNRAQDCFWTYDDETRCGPAGRGLRGGNAAGRADAISLRWGREVQGSGSAPPARSDLIQPWAIWRGTS